MKQSKKGLRVGHIIGPAKMCHDFIWRVNVLSANFGFRNISTKRQLFMSYCTSFYGVCLWNLQMCSGVLYYLAQRYQKTFQSTSLHSL